MLQKLYIKNYAIIDELELHFHKGMTVLTGETGAGKSIILGALSLILGERADTAVLIDKENKCIVEAVFETGIQAAVHSFLSGNDFDAEDITTIRREISPGGKSRAFINDTPANLSQLQELGNMLVDLNRQFDNRLLHHDSFQYDIIDSFSENRTLIPEYRKQYQQYNKLNARLKELKVQEQQALAESEYLQYLYEELQAADFRTGEIEEAEERMKSIQHQEEIINSIQNALYILSESDENQIINIKKIISSLNTASRYAPGIQPLVERLDAITEELKDIEKEIIDFKDNISYNESEISILKERIDTGFRLLKKHNLSGTEELLRLQEELQGKISGFESLGNDIEQYENELNELEFQIEKKAGVLLENREKSASYIARNLETTLSKIGMPNAQLNIQISKTNNYHSYGYDSISFLIDANRSGVFQPISKVASGGELSRILLAIKHLVFKNLSLGTLIFDEVDSAISGEAAKQVSVLMKGIADRHQVIVLTHQAQMAAKGDLHLFIYKDAAAGSEMIRTRVKLLEKTERVEKIAQMIGGAEPGTAAMQSAEEMLLG